MNLSGGIPNRDIDGDPAQDIPGLSRYWQVIPGVRAALFKKADRAGYSALRIPQPEIKAAILGHPEFTEFNDSATRLFATWKKGAVPLLKGFAKDGHRPTPQPRLHLRRLPRHPQRRSRTAVKPGHKQTEVGVIPEEWDTVRTIQRSMPRLARLFHEGGVRAVTFVPVGVAR